MSTLFSKSLIVYAVNLPYNRNYKAIDMYGLQGF